MFYYLPINGPIKLLGSGFYIRDFLLLDGLPSLQLRSAIYPKQFNVILRTLPSIVLIRLDVTSSFSERLVSTSDTSKTNFHSFLMATKPPPESIKNALKKILKNIENLGVRQRQERITFLRIKIVFKIIKYVC